MQNVLECFNVLIKNLQLQTFSDIFEHSGHFRTFRTFWNMFGYSRTCLDSFKHFGHFRTCGAFSDIRENLSDILGIRVVAAVARHWRLAAATVALTVEAAIMRMTFLSWQRPGVGAMGQSSHRYDWPRGDGSIFGHQNCHFLFIC